MKYIMLFCFIRLLFEALVKLLFINIIFCFFFNILYNMFCIVLPTIIYNQKYYQKFKIVIYPSCKNITDNRGVCVCVGGGV